MYPITIEATSQEDDETDSVVVYGNYTIQVLKAKIVLPLDEANDWPEGDYDGSGYIEHGNESSLCGQSGGGVIVSGDGTDDIFPSMIRDRMDQFISINANQR